MSSEDEMNVWEHHPSNAVHGQTRKRTKANSPGPNGTLQERALSKRDAAIYPDSDDDRNDVPADATVAKPQTKAKLRSKAMAMQNNQQNQMVQEKSKPSKRPPASEDAMEMDQASELNVPMTSQPSATGTSKSHSASDIKNRKELDHWKQKAKDLEAQRDALSNQLEELCQIRKTEPEQILEQLQIQYEERAKTQDALIKELTSQLARVEPLSRTGQVVALHFLTREAADEEKRAVEQDMARLQEAIKAKEDVIDEKTKRIVELEQSVQDAVLERDAEIERSKELLARAAPKGTPNSRLHSKRPFGMDDPKTTEVIKFYEDMSNLLVTNVKFEHATPDPEEPEVIFHCIYTYYEMTRRDDDIEGERIGEKSIVFTMRLFNGFGGPNGEPASDDDFIHRRIKYTPLHLDKESDAFVKGLEYMGESFTFPCAQQGLFLNSLREKIRDAGKDASEPGSDIEAGDHNSQS